MKKKSVKHTQKSANDKCFSLVKEEEWRERIYLKLFLTQFNVQLYFYTLFFIFVPVQQEEIEKKVFL